jgi:uncharacterized protein YggE
MIEAYDRYMRILAAVVCCSLVPLFAQQNLRRAVSASGEGSVTVRPDAARVTVAVVKQAPTAAEAASQNATVAAAVIDAIRRLLGPNSEVRTITYNLAPVYTSPRDGTPPQIMGFVATNFIEAIASDPNLAGRVIDAAVAAGASRIDGIRLFLRDDQTARSQALRTASQRARAKAEAIALGLGVRLGQILSARETVTSLPIGGIDRGGSLSVTAPTPIETGTLEVRAMVAVDIEIVP